MNRMGKRLLVILAACCLTACSSEDTSIPTNVPPAAAPAELPPPPPPPPPPQLAAVEPPSTDSLPEAPAESPPERSPRTPAERNPVDRSRPLTPEEARAAIEELGGRVAADSTGRVVRVFLNRTTVNDGQISVIKYLPDLEVLNLTGTPIGNEGLEHAFGLTKLKRVYAAHTNISEEGEEELKEFLPDCEIYR